jgi:hypothetical protein
MKLLERADPVCRRRGMSGRTAQVFCHWIRRFLTYSACAHGQWLSPERLGTADVESFLNHLVGERRVAASTQNQALNAPVFLYRHVLDGAIARRRASPEGRQADPRYAWGDAAGVTPLLTLLPRLGDLERERRRDGPMA